MTKANSTAVSSLLKSIRKGLDERIEEKVRGVSLTGPVKVSVKTLGVRSAAIKQIARDVIAEARGAVDYSVAVALVDAAVARKVREEILVAIDILERFRREYAPSLFVHLDRWSSVADDLEVAECIGTKVASALLVQDPAKMATVRKWARTRSTGRRRLAILSVTSLITEGRREVASALDICELLLNEDHPVLVGEVAALLKDATKIDAKAVQDFLFRRSIDGNPEILRAGSENLDAARRAALIAKLEAQAATVAGTFVAVR
jgi:hypothetical protein